MESHAARHDDGTAEASLAHFWLHAASVGPAEHAAATTFWQ
jgi:hypothetical protein